MITAIHVEDEQANIKLLNYFVKQYYSDSITIIGNAPNSVKAFELVKKLKPQLVYLDVELNNGDAFEFLELCKEFQFEIIFITAHSNFAHKAFRFNAIDYLLKPLDIELFKIATQKAISKIKTVTKNNSILLPHNTSSAVSNINKIGIPCYGSTEFLNLNNIVSCEAIGGNTKIYQINNKLIICTRNLKFIETVLPTNNFVRVHNKWLVNVNSIKKYFNGMNSYLEMENNQTIPVSIRKKKRINDIF
jgi:two-component system, LytTR family, response regulator